MERILLSITIFWKRQCIKLLSQIYPSVDKCWNSITTVILGPVLMKSIVYVWMFMCTSNASRDTTETARTQKHREYRAEDQIVWFFSVWVFRPVWILRPVLGLPTQKSLSQRGATFRAEDGKWSVRLPGSVQAQTTDPLMLSPQILVRPEKVSLVSLVHFQTGGFCCYSWEFGFIVKPVVAGST